MILARAVSVLCSGSKRFIATVQKRSWLIHRKRLQNTFPMLLEHLARRSFPVEFSGKRVKVNLK